MRPSLTALGLRDRVSMRVWGGLVEEDLSSPEGTSYSVLYHPVQSQEKQLKARFGTKLHLETQEPYVTLRNM